MALPNLTGLTWCVWTEIGKLAESTYLAGQWKPLIF